MNVVLLGCLVFIVIIGIQYQKEKGTQVKTYGIDEDEELLVIGEGYDLKKVCVFMSFVMGLGAIGFGAILVSFYDHPDAINFLLGSLGCLVIIGLFWLAHLIISKIEIVVTDKRIYGRNWLGKRMDIPLDSVSSVGIGLFDGIWIASSSGRLYFAPIENRDIVYSVICDLIVERQGVSDSTVAEVPLRSNVNETPPRSNADELKKYKELLDMDAITQEEYNAKKKQLLDL